MNVGDRKIDKSANKNSSISPSMANEFGAEFYELLATCGHGKDETVVAVLLEIVGTMVNALENRDEHSEAQKSLVKKDIGEMTEAINGFVDAINVSDSDDNLLFDDEYQINIYEDFS